MRARSLSRALIAALLLSLCVQPVVRAQRAPRKLGAAVAPIRLVPHGSEPITVSGLHSYFGAVEVDSFSSGLVLSNRLPFERYLLGLNEVPVEWPFEALKAQVVAARTYALFTLGQGRTGEAGIYGYDICATVQCQVFSGADVISTENGERWVAAVDETRGQTILYDGAPILARYHSTSGGRTLDNEDAFEPGEPSYPYLRSVESPWEGPSPLDRWVVRFPKDHLTRILSHAGYWPRGRIVNVVSRGPLFDAPFPQLMIRGVQGRRKVRITMDAKEFREVVRDVAPALYPGAYPSAGETSTGRLPETLPSHRIEVETKGRFVVVEGRGWGHGSGMSQWGAHGLAQQGASYADILGHYYSGVTLGTTDTDRSIEVGVATGQSTVTALGSFSIVDGRGKVLVPRALGSWTFRSAGSGAVAIDPPRGYGLPLEVGIVRAPKRVIVGEPTFLTVALSRPAKVRTQTDESPTGYRDPGVEIKEAGKRRVVWLAPLEEGRYRVRVRARAGPALKLSEPVEIVVRAAASPPSGPDPGRGDDIVDPTGFPWAWVLAGLALLGLVLVFALVRASKSRPTS
ncbi:MAG: SpoIID/LytB domain-containing protein [Actinomycetota bacterium]